MICLSICVMRRSVETLMEGERSEEDGVDKRSRAAREGKTICRSRTT